MKVQDVMTKDVVTAPSNSSVREIARLMTDHNVGTVIITDQSGRLEGIVTDREVVIDCVGKGLDPSMCRVEDIMTKGITGGLMGTKVGGIVTAGPDDDILDVARRMGDQEIRRMPVVQADRVVGVVSLADLAKELKEAISGFFDEISAAEK